MKTFTQEELNKFLSDVNCESEPVKYTWCYRLCRRILMRPQEHIHSFSKAGKLIFTYKGSEISQVWIDELRRGWLRANKKKGVK